MLNKTEEKELLKTPVFTVVEKTFKEFTKFKPVGLNCADWVMVIMADAYTQEANPVCVFVKQTRFGCEDTTVEFPCGTMEPGEEPIDAAMREFREETGMEIHKRDLTYLGSFNPNFAYFNNKMHVFFARTENLTKLYYNRNKQSLDENEDCELFLGRLNDMYKDYLSASGISLAALMLWSKKQNIITNWG